LLLAGVAVLLVAATGLVLLARPGTVRGLHWAREHLLNPFALTAMGTIALVLVTLILWRADRRSPGATATPTAGERTAMLHRVRYNWITGILDHSLSQAALLALGLQRRPEILELGTRALRRPGQQPEILPHATPIVRVFDEVGGGLLIVGAPGGGKTTLLLQLADDLLERAERDPDQPIPAVVNLASWARQRQPLAAWLAGELWDSYKVPQRTAEAWIGQRSLVLLLDGLDEVAERHRAACAAAINDYRREYGLTGLVVCSRTQELEQLGVRLELEEAIELEPPTDAQIDSYLKHLEATGTPLADVRAELAADPGLRELLRSPLMLHVIALAYHGRPAPALYQPGSTDQRRERLWEAYVLRMFEQRPLDTTCRYDANQAIDWLVWLAWGLRNHDQTEFHLDRLDLSWLPVAPASPRVMRWISRITAAVARPAEELHWSRKTLRSRVAAPGQSGSDLFKMIGWAMIFPLAGLTAEMRDERTAPNEGIRRSARNALLCGLVMTLWWMLIEVLNSLIPGTHGSGTFTSQLLGLVRGAFILGLVGGMIFGGGACLVHYFVRAVLPGEIAPLRYCSFLDAMTERLLLRRSGSGYLFAHRLLRDYLADFAPEGVSAVVLSPASTSATIPSPD